MKNWQIRLILPLSVLCAIVSRRREVTMRAAKGFSEDAQPFDAQSAAIKPTVSGRLKIDSAGRILIPAQMRAEMLVKAGDTVAAQVIDGEFRIISPKVAVRRAQAIARKLLPADFSLVDDLIADRRAEAKKDADEADAWRAAHGLPPLD